MVRNALLLGLTFCIGLQAQFTFDKVEVRTAFGAAKEGNSGRLVIDGERIRFTKKNGAEYFSMPSKGVSNLFYSRVSGRRIGAAILITPFLLFSKGRKHYMTITFDDGAQAVGAVEFKLHKDNYRGVLRTVEQVTGLTMEYDQEGVKESEQTVATRGNGSEAQATLGTVDISSDPEGAEIEIDGAFVGNAPRSRNLSAGEHQIRLRKRGYADWERRIAIVAGETLQVTAELEKQ